MLRDKDGCPWDREQTHKSLKKSLMEECAELMDASEAEDDCGMREEMGDLLMNIALQAVIAEERGAFTFRDVVHDIAEKMIRRHPHVFGTAAADTSEEVLVNWEALKRQEKGQQTTADAMDAVARSLPALCRADKLQSKAAKAGIEYADVSGALDKLDEETGELRQAVETGGDVAGELGDVLFAAVKVGRFCGIDPEDAIAGTCEKFIRRFRAMEQEAARQGRALHDMTLEEMTALWNGAKERS